MISNTPVLEGLTMTDQKSSSTVANIRSKTLNIIWLMRLFM